MQGRVLHELFEGSPPPVPSAGQENVITALSKSVTLKAHFDILGESTYLNYVKTERKQ
jgi:hypothetical protein